ncbi:MAG: DASS family sodium-coupled anion symporter [Bacteroidota bacterium]
MAGISVKRFGLVLGPVAFLIFFFWPNEIINGQADNVIAFALWMIIWWMTEAVSISVTALIPIVFFPAFGLASMKEVGASYGDPIVFLFLGGFIIALALEKVNLHKRVALGIIRYTGSSPNRVLLGFMIATAFMSMWISNTASTVVMLPIALQVIQLLVKDEDGFSLQDRKFALKIMLGIAFAANVGGIATIIGTPPNMAMIGFVEKSYGLEISFMKWMAVGLPFSCVMLLIIYAVLTLFIFKQKDYRLNDPQGVINREIQELGGIKSNEKWVIAIFSLTIALWIFKNQINEWQSLISFSNAGIGMLGAFLLFCIPLLNSKDTQLLEWKDTKNLPWGIIILFGGGLALASAMKNTGIIDLIGSSIAAQGHISIIAIVSILIAIILFMTELMSNVALITVFTPVVAGIALGLDQPMLELLIPITMAASCAFMLPMATPPNAIVFASGHVKVAEMAKAGIVLNIISILILILFARFYIPYVFS